jgi:1,4-alpha-glucan branching enzyme
MEVIENWFSEYEIHLFNEGTYYQAYEKLGAQLVEHDGQEGCHFAVWAPNAEAVSVVGDFNNWSTETHKLKAYHSSGIWTGFTPGIALGANYKYHIQSKHYGYSAEKADPYAFFSEVPPKSASRVWYHDGYSWLDSKWMAERHSHNSLNSPISIYELHVGSWRKKVEEDNRSLSYKELAHELAKYVSEMGFTHVELMPVMEHPFDGSWGYQSTGYFSPTSRFGTPQDFMFLIDVLHQYGIGVILDWVPAHFPTDGHGLGFFDGTHLYEHEDPRQGFHQDWGTYVFNFGRNEVVNFLISSALFWFDKFHIDGIRVDAVASMLYNDYSRKEGEWIPNKFGGRENLEAISFLRKLNEVIYSKFPDAMMMAEESTAWPMVSRPTYVGGLGFGFKWNMGWMNDTLSYFSKEPVHRAYHHNNLTFSLLYAFHENFVLPFSHDEVVHQKGSLISKMPGDDWQKFANLRLLYGYMFTHPGKKLLFMGCEFAQWNEWKHSQSLDWHLLDFSSHKGMALLVRDLNRLLRSEGPLHEIDFDPSGFQWIDCNDHAQSVLSYVRRGKNPLHQTVCVFNFTPVPRYNYRLGVSEEGYWEELLNTDSGIYGGSDMGNAGGVMAEKHPMHGQPYSLNLTLPPLSALLFRPTGY